MRRNGWQNLGSGRAARCESASAETGRAGEGVAPRRRAFQGIHVAISTGRRVLGRLWRLSGILGRGIGAQRGAVPPLTESKRVAARLS